MSEQKLTPWFPPNVKPARPGVYEVRLRKASPGTCFAYFDGARWTWAFSSFRVAAVARVTDGAVQAKWWRGLAGDPDAR